MSFRERQSEETFREALTRTLTAPFRLGRGLVDFAISTMVLLLLVAIYSLGWSFNPGCPTASRRDGVFALSARGPFFRH